MFAHCLGISFEMSESFPKTQNIRSECLQPVLISNELGVIDKTKNQKKTPSKIVFILQKWQKWVFL